MNWLRRLWGRVRRWLFGKPLPAPFRTVRVEEQPERPEPDTVYLIGEGEYLWFVTLLCPCGCRATIQLNLLPQARPCWRVDKHADGTVTLFPSVWRRQGCKSHFWIRRGRVEWCPAGTPEDPDGRVGGWVTLGAVHGPGKTTKHQARKLALSELSCSDQQTSAQSTPYGDGGRP